jgi:D-lyxose ketol-isomerase
MIKRSELRRYQQLYLEMLDDAGIALTEHERQNIEVAELGLNEVDRTGLGLLVYVNNDRYCAKELMMLPRQTCPQHQHPPVNDDPGKRETFRCRQGEVYLYLDGEPAANPVAKPPAGSEAYYTVWHEIVLRPGAQYTIEPGRWHWFQAGDQGAIISEFSTTSRDEADLFTDPRIERMPEIEED